MKAGKHTGCLIPLIAFLFGLSPIFVEHFRTQSIQAWNQAPNSSGRLMRLFAKEYEETHGRKPTTEEFRQYSVQRFRKALDTVRVDEDFKVRSRSDIPPVPEKPATKSTVPESKEPPAAE